MLFYVGVKRKAVPSFQEGVEKSYSTQLKSQREFGLLYFISVKVEQHNSLKYIHISSLEELFLNILLFEVNSRVITF